MELGGDSIGNLETLSTLIYLKPLNIFSIMIGFLGFGRKLRWPSSPNNLFQDPNFVLLVCVILRTKFYLLFSFDAGNIASRLRLMKHSLVFWKEGILLKV